MSSMPYNVYWNQNYVASEYEFDTTRKSAELAAVIDAGATPATLVDPVSFTDQAADLIKAVHTREYVSAVNSGRPEALAESQGFAWDPMIPTMAIAHSSGLVAAVTEVLGGSGSSPGASANRVAASLSSGLHHARADRGNGFCTFNGLVVAAHAALGLGAQRVLVLDLDAHCGGGTRSMTDPTSVIQIDVSTIPFDRWEPSGFDSLVMANANDYLERVTEALALADQAGPFDLVLYNAGMDPSDSGVTATQLHQREQMVAEWADRHDHRLVYALAGGYTNHLTMDELVELHKLTVDAFG